MCCWPLCLTRRDEEDLVILLNQRMATQWTPWLGQSIGRACPRSPVPEIVARKATVAAYIVDVLRGTSVNDPR